MQVQFKYPRKLGKHTYQKGIHEVPDEFADDWFFKAQVEAKDCVIIESQVAEPEVKAEKPKAKPTSQSQRK